MKNKFIAAIALLLMAGIISCSKNSNRHVQSPGKYVNTGGSDYQAQLQSLSDKYMASNPKTNVPLLPKWLKVACADVGGAIDGAKAGSIFGPWGAGIGAALGGAAASILASESVAAPSGYQNDPHTFPGNPANHMNNIGFNHYYVLNSAIANEANYTQGGTYHNATFYNYAQNFFINENIYQPSDFDAFTEAQCHDVVQHTDENNAEYLSDYLNVLLNENKISNDVYNALVPYVECMEATTDKEQFVQYSIDAENIILSAPMTDEDRDQVLAAMATARYGVQYWWDL